MRKADNLPPSCAVVTKSGNLNFLEPSGPLQACDGTALPFTLLFLQSKGFYCTLHKCSYGRLVTDCTCYLIVVFSEFNVHLCKGVARIELVCIM